jgi:hypothetical protein
VLRNIRYDAPPSSRRSPYADGDVVDVEAETIDDKK